MAASKARTARRPFALVRRSLRGWLEPIDAHAALAARGLQPQLLDGSGAHPEARRAHLAFDAEVEVRIQGHAIEEHWANGAIEALHEEPLAYLRRMTARYAAEVAEPEGFAGGWIGAFGFGFTRHVEPTLPAGAPTDEPDAVLQLCRSAVTWDRAARTWSVACADLDGDEAAAARRADEVAAWLDEAARAARQTTPTPARGAPQRTHATPTWTTSLDQAAFEATVAAWKDLIHDGDLFQANLATRFSGALATSPHDAFRALVAANPGPYMALLDLAGTTLVSASPEQLFAASGGRIRSRPIAGTRKRGATPSEDDAMAQELASDTKEQAEHTMLVDLVRNDVAKVCVPGTTRVAERMSVERYRHVMHLASSIEGTLRPETTFVDWLCALFPGGTVTGAPKVRATQRILEAEPVARGYYTGSAGYLSWSQNAHWNILIRTLQIRKDPNGAAMAHVHAGSGIVADSDPPREWREAGRKARALLEAASGAPPTTPSPGRLGEVTVRDAWDPPRSPTRIAARVLLVDNYDSFVHNLADYVAALGATVHVVRNDADWRAAVATFAPTHVILSPGPGWPAEAGCTPDVARDLHGRLPILGVCLGHQTLGHVHGGRVLVHPNGPVHGTADLVHHDGGGLFADLPSPFPATRYHSLIVDADAMTEWVVDARLADGTVMALRHRTAPTFGLQFHPESLCTAHGLELVARFLRVHT